jgi:thiamine-phosphate pyrophosphorylase
MNLPCLYPIADASLFPDTAALCRFVQELADSGVTLLQYRNKAGSARLLLEQARDLKRRFGSRLQLIMNDRADLCVAAEFDGVHVGQDDLSPAGARLVIGPSRILGVSTHNVEQVREADATSADYIAIGPVFATVSKQDPDPVIGLAGVRQARTLTRKPLVAIGGITRENCRAVIEAGADSVAVIADFLGDPQHAAEDFLRRLR